MQREVAGAAELGREVGWGRDERARGVEGRRLNPEGHGAVSAALNGGHWRLAHRHVEVRVGVDDAVGGGSGARAGRNEREQKGALHGDDASSSSYGGGAAGNAASVGLST